MVKRHRARKLESVIVEALEIHDKLNPKIWDSNDNLLPDVKDKILDIVDEFEKNVKEMTEIDLKGKTVRFKNKKTAKTIDKNIFQKKK